MNEYMERAVEVAYEGVRSGAGGPFGAVIVLDGDIVGSGHNRVVEDNDPTAHAEIVAIRSAACSLGRFDLSDCVLYSTCEPCPMCRSAIHWARIREVVYGCTREDASRIGFDDELLYRILDGSMVDTGYRSRSEARDSCRRLFEYYMSLENRVRY